METPDAIRARRNVRQYTDQPVAREDLERILEAGRRAPSASNWQPWHFVVVTDRERLGVLSTVWQGAAYVAHAAAVIALVAAEPDDEKSARMLQYDLGQATAYLMLAATDLGIATGHANVKDQDAARQALGFPEDHRCWYLIGLGHPADRPLRPVVHPDRRPFDDVVHWERW
ncbi:MAG TPA: nitroreductase family protein [Acidimicrobiales bacterium]|nr:nitroreductase family protein [Acidimicrobiales bacterium]